MPPLAEVRHLAPTSIEMSDHIFQSVPRDVREIICDEPVRRIIEDKCTPRVHETYSQFEDGYEFHQFVKSAIVAEYQDRMRLREYNVQEGWE